jgi:hypothetical protein
MKVEMQDRRILNMASLQEEDIAMNAEIINKFDTNSFQKRKLS